LVVLAVILCSQHSPLLQARQNESRSTARHSEAKNQIERVALDVKQGMPQTTMSWGFSRKLW
jgi:hypothetical protein